MATTFEATVVVSFPAGSDLSDFQFYPVALTTSAAYPNGALGTIGATATKPFGVLQDAPDTAGDMAAVVIVGPTKCVAYGGTINAGDSLGVDATGAAGATTTDNRWILGDALETVTDAGNYPIISIVVDVHRY
jgi:hypothetical protein